MSEEKKEEAVHLDQVEGPKFRKLVIETDGNRIKISTNETTGVLELKAILTEILTSLRQ